DFIQLFWHSLLSRIIQPTKNRTDSDDELCILVTIKLYSMEFYIRELLDSEEDDLKALGKAVVRNNW
ncbi:hypothetical protein CEXT_134441, partial [Caerostris extrusa]